ncbi:MAG: hypothetical protein ABWY25_10805 [Paenisporosarcina sp.]
MADDVVKPARTRIIAPLKRMMGLKEGQSLMDFGAELKQLTDEDCEDFAKGLEDGTLNY